MKLPKFSRTARVIEHSEDGITFEVDAVKKTPRELPTEGAHRHFAKHSGPKGDISSMSLDSPLKTVSNITALHNVYI
jgi:hypothetical protein